MSNLQDKKWATRATVLQMFEIPHRKLDRMRSEGWVRTVKMGDYRQSTRLYRIRDVEETLQTLATGGTPSRQTS